MWGPLRANEVPKMQFPKVEEAKHQSGSGWIRNWDHFELDFEFISWILKSFRNGFLALCSCLQIAITSSFQLRFVHHLKYWTSDFLSFKEIYGMSKMDFRKYDKFVFKVTVYVATKFWVINFHAAKSFPMFSCLLSYSIMVISHLPNSWYPLLAFLHGPWVLTRLFPYLTLSWFFKI